MTTTALPGTERHPHAQAVLGAALTQAGRPSHAYLFQGPAGAGKRTAARAFAAELLSEGSPDPENARARVQRGSHPDLTWVTPSGAHELLVADIDTAVVEAASRTPFESSRRVFVIEAADTMIEPAANRMLKTLEEPAPFVHLVLLTDSPTEVLPTIASRCQAVRFDPLPADEIAAKLEAEGVEPGTAHACARLGLGDAARARTLASQDGAALRSATQRFARAAAAGEMSDAPWAGLLAQARAAGQHAQTALDEGFESELELLPKRDQRRARTEQAERGKRAQRRAMTGTLDLGLELIALWFRDCACVAWAAAELVANSDRADEVAADASCADPQRFMACVELVEETRQRLPLNVTEVLALEALGYRAERALSR